MPNDNRVYITLDNGMPENAKIEALSDRAFRCLIGLWCWSSRNLKDGFVPEAVWLKRTNPKVRAELVGGLAHPVEGGVYMHDYLEHQRSRAEVEALREKRARAGSLGGKRSAATRAHDKWSDSQGAAHA